MSLEEDALLTSTSLSYWNTVHRVTNSTHVCEPDSTATIILPHSGVQSALAWAWQRDRSSRMGVRDTEHQAFLERLRPLCFETCTHDMKERGSNNSARNTEDMTTWQSLADQARPGGSTSQTLRNEVSRRQLTQISCP